MSSTSAPSSPAPPTPSSAPSYPTTKYTSVRHASFPYASADFVRDDSTPDKTFYASPRLVTHIDDHAISKLREYYSHALPTSGRVLDFCSSWISHFPEELEARARKTASASSNASSTEGKAPDPGHATDELKLEVIGMGLSEPELAANPILASRIVQDLNADPLLPGSVRDLDAATCVVSIDYLIHPLETLQSVRSRMKDGGTVHLVISNRFFPTKAIRRWLQVGEQERLSMAADYLWFAGFREVEILTLSDGSIGEGDGQGPASGLRGFMAAMGMRGVDPLWVVRGKRM
ncbi:MAG: hypothetical protein MMC23_008669 [Stictis urceolatum]|nr:hypothetical protein [Stictis urceolata]